MEQQVGMETTLFGGPPELGNMLKLANGQIGFMTIFAHPLFANVADIIPAMSFAAEEILTNKGVWFTRAEQEKRRDQVRRESTQPSGAVSPRSQSPAKGYKGHAVEHAKDGYYPRSSPLQNVVQPQDPGSSRRRSSGNVAQTRVSDSPSQSRRSSLAAVAGIAIAGEKQASRGLSSASKSGLPQPRSSSHENLRPNDSSAGQRRLNDSREIMSSKNENPNRSTESAPESLQQYESTDGALDERRDVGMSMRAGTMDVPTLDSESQSRNDRAPSPDPLSKFKFATNKEEEPVREYNPEQHYPPVHQSARASMPTNNNGHRTAAIAAIPGHNSKPVTDEGEGRDASTGQSGPKPTSSQQSEFERQKARAPSAPNRLGQRQSGTDSPRSFGFGSRESSKQDVRMTTVTNGEEAESGEREGVEASKERGGTMRRRSRIRLKFWKKKDKDNPAEGGGEGDDEP